MTPQKSASQVATHSCRRVACRVISATTFCSIGALALVPGIYAKRAERISYNEFVLHHFDALAGKAYRIVVNRWSTAGLSSSSSSRICTVAWCSGARDTIGSILIDPQLPEFRFRLIGGSTHDSLLPSASAYQRIICSFVGVILLRTQIVQRIIGPAASVDSYLRPGSFRHPR